MLNKKLLSAAVIAASAMTASAPALAALDLTGQGYYQYGDFQSYSLPIMAYYYDLTNGGGVGPGNPYYIPSSPGNIQDQIVIYTGAGGPGSPVNDNSNPSLGSAFVDNAFAAPNGVQTPNFQMSPAGEPTPVGSVGSDLDGYWDISLTALKTFLGGDANNLAFLFNNNDTNEDQNLAIWGKFWVTNNQTGGIEGTYCLSNMEAVYGQGGIPNGTQAYTCSTGELAGNPLVDPTTQETDYIQSGGEVCIIPSTGDIVACGTTGSVRFNHNLGANQAAYVGVAPELNTLLASLFAEDGLYTLHVDLRLGCAQAWDPTATGGKGKDKAINLEDSPECVMKKIDNGYEQFFITSLANPPICTPGVDCPVPEPGTLALIAVALFGLGYSSRLRGKRG